MWEKQRENLQPEKQKVVTPMREKQTETMRIFLYLSFLIYFYSIFIFFGHFSTSVEAYASPRRHEKRAWGAPQPRVNP